MAALGSFTSQERTLAYRQHGAGPLVVLLPGNTASSAHFESELEFFGRARRAIALDLAGTGASQRLENWPEDWWEQCAVDVSGLLDHLGAPCADLVGTSGGGIVALLAAIRFPGKVRSVIADSVPLRCTSAALYGIVAGRDYSNPEQAAFWELGHGADWQGVVERDSELLRRHAGRGGLDPFGERLSQVACAVLLTGGLCDELIPELAGQLCQMARELPDSQMFLAGQGGHPLIWSRPELFRSQAARWLAGLDARGHTHPWNSTATATRSSGDS